jgi:alanine dehydrogenase
MVLFLREADTQRLVSMADAIELVETALRAKARGEATNRPRVRVQNGRSGLNVLVASDSTTGYLAVRSYSVGGPGASNSVLLYRAEDGRPVALLEARWLSLARTAAATAVGTRCLARPDARVAAFIGAGRQAFGHLPALALVRDLASVRCYAPTREHAERLAAEATALGLEARATDTAAEAVEGADIVTTITSSRGIALEGRWLRRGMHVNAVGVNFNTNRELDDAAVLAADLIAVDDLENARDECGDVLPLIEAGRLAWDQLHDLGAILNGDAPGRPGPDAITLFESQGLSIEDVAVAAAAYERARAASLGEELPFG